MGRSYYQVDIPHRTDFMANQVEETPKKEAKVAAVVNSAPPSPQFTMLLDMIKSLQLEVVGLQQESRRLPGVRNDQINSLAGGHVQWQCPGKERMPLNIRGSR